MESITFYVWRITFPNTGEVLMSSRPYSTQNRAIASLKQMAKHYSELHEDSTYYLDILCTADHAPKTDELHFIEQTTGEDEIFTFIHI